MLRFLFVILRCILVIPYYVVQMIKYERQSERYSEEDCYSLALKVVRLIKKSGRIDTYIAGTENLPKEGGYIMYSNHQGKYDALGVMIGHKKPCTLIIAKKQSKPIVTTQFIDLIRAKRLDFEDIRQQVAIMNAVTEEVKAGRRYLIFPEGGYQDNRNTLQEFKVGSFKCAERAKCPIIPVALYDSYKPFGINSIRRVQTQVHFLKAIPYEEFKGLKTIQIRDMVVQRIKEHIDKLQNKQTGEAMFEKHSWFVEEKEADDAFVKEQLS